MGALHKGADEECPYETPRNFSQPPTVKFQ
jgi:hypothetical protein